MPTGHGKSWNLGRPFSRPGKSWKIANHHHHHPGLVGDVAVPVSARQVVLSCAFLNPDARDVIKTRKSETKTKTRPRPDRPRPRPRPRPGRSRPRPRPRPAGSRPRPRPRPQKSGFDRSRDQDQVSRPTSLLSCSHWGGGQDPRVPLAYSPGKCQQRHAQSGGRAVGVPAILNDKEHRETVRM